MEVANIDAQTITPSYLKQLRLANAVFFFISGFGYSSWASRIPSIQQKLHLNEAQLGAVLFALPIGLMLTMPITGWLLSRFSSKRILFLGAMFFNVVLCLPGFTGYMWQLALVLLCFGSARNLLNLSANTQAVSVQKLYDRSIMASFHGIWSMAGFAGAALGYFMVAADIAPSYHLLAVSMLLTIFTIYFSKTLLHEQPVATGRKPAFSWPEKSLLAFGIISFASMACENTMYDWSAIYFQKAIHSTKAASTAAFVCYMIAMTTGRFSGDRLVSKIGIKTLLKYSGIFIFSGLFLAVLLPYPITAGLGFILVGFGVSCIVPFVFSMAGKSKTSSSSAALASISTVGYLGFLMVPPLVGFVAQAAGLRWSFGIISVLGLLVIGMVFKLSEE